MIAYAKKLKLHLLWTAKNKALLWPCTVALLVHILLFVGLFGFPELNSVASKPVAVLAVKLLGAENIPLEPENKPTRTDLPVKKTFEAKTKVHRDHQPVVESSDSEIQKDQYRNDLLKSDLDSLLDAEGSRLKKISDSIEIQAYISKMIQLIESHWSRPKSARLGMVAEFILNLTPTGEVAKVSLVNSSGDSAFDRAAEQAIYKAKRLPVASDPELFEDYFRTVRLLFRPTDLPE